jgi:hypothetical protein
MLPFIFSETDITLHQRREHLFQSGVGVLAQKFPVLHGKHSPINARQKQKPTLFMELLLQLQLAVVPGVTPC